MKDTAVVILAAGKGTRMRSQTPKVLHHLAGLPLVGFPIQLAEQLRCARIVTVVGHERKQVETAIRRLAKPRTPLSFAHQVEQWGTGHAVISALPKLRGHKGRVLILSGDVPLLDKASVTRLANAYKRSGGPLALLSFIPDDPSGYGRVVRKGKRVIAIREHRDCSRDEREIGEVNAGIYLVDLAFLRRALRRLSTDNSQGEFYLTDIVEMAAEKHKVSAIPVAPELVSGINDRYELAALEDRLRSRINTALMKSGVTIRQPETVHIDLGVVVNPDTELQAGVQLRGRTKIGRGCRIETGAVVTNSKIKDNAMIRAYSVVEESLVGPGSRVGPMARLGPGSVIGAGSTVGNFVELDNAVLDAGSAAARLCYLADEKAGR